MAIDNTLAYNDTATITAVKSFIAQAPEQPTLTSTLKLITVAIYTVSQ
jgi:hypothetical protein